MPRYRMPHKYGRWPARDDVVEYLRDYRRRLDLPVETGVEVERIDRVGPHWLLQTTRGSLEAKVAVVATGHDHDPLVPDWPGAEGYPGELLHSSSYREPSRFRGRDVLVASARNSGSEIAYELARGGAGGDLSAHGLPPSPVGVQTDARRLHRSTSSTAASSRPCGRVRSSSSPRSSPSTAARSCSPTARESPLRR